jgi:predicted ferric reductase
MRLEKSINISLFLLVLYITLCSCQFKNATRKYTNCKLIERAIVDPTNSTNKLQRYIRIQYNITADKILFAIETNFTGWVALGLSDSWTYLTNTTDHEVQKRIMTNDGNQFSDAVVVAYADTTDTADFCFGGCLLDYNLQLLTDPILFPSPVPDSVQDWVKTTFTNVDGVIIGEGERKLDTGDVLEDRIINGTKKNNFIWAANEDKPDPFGGIAYHGEIWGTFSLDLGVKQSCEAEISNKTEYENPDKTWKVEWVIDATKVFIDFTITCKTTGWVSFGISNKPSMDSGVDMVTSWVDGNGKLTIVDAFSDSRNNPRQDKKNDVMNPTGEQKDGTTIIKYRRKLDTGDKAEDVVIENKPQFLLWSYHNALDGTDPNNYPKHTHKDNTGINFFSGAGGTTKKAAGLQAGYIFLIIIGGVAGIWIVIRHFKKCIKGISNGPARDVEMGDGDTPTLPPKKSAKCTTRWEGRLGQRIDCLEWEVVDFFLISFYVAANLVGLLVGCKDQEAKPYDYGRCIGHLLGANALIIAIPATRNSVLVFFLGIPFDRAIKYHRMIGYWIFTLVSLHFFLQLGYFGTVANINMNLFGGVNNYQYLFGFLGWICVVLMVIFSLPPIRRKMFELFMSTHYLFFGFFIFGSLHTPVFFNPFAITAAAIYGFDMFLRIISQTYPMQSTLLEVHGDITRVRFPKSSFIKKINGYRVGQYVFLNFPGISFLEWHPFSVTSAPKDDFVEVNIKAIGDYTTKLNEYATNKQKVYVRCEGPYGNLNLNFRRYPTVLLICGGIGVTPVIGILKDIYNRKRRRALTDVHCIWVIQAEAQYESFQDVFESISQAAETEGFPTLHLKIQVTRSQNQLAPPLYTGRPNFKQTMDDIHESKPKEHTFVFVCGPVLMVNDANDNANKQRRKGRGFEFHKEIFEF